MINTPSDTAVQYQWDDTSCVFTPMQKAVIPVSLLLGYSVYTTFRFPLTKYLWQDHFNRLSDNACQMGLLFKADSTSLYHALCKHATSLLQDHLVFRLTLLPQVQTHLDLLHSRTLTPSVLLLSVRHAPELKHYFNEEAPQATVKLKTVNHCRSLPTIKHGSMADVLLLRKQAMAEGFEDILLTHTGDNITETSTANCFFIKDKTLVTAHPQKDQCLGGITRHWIIKNANTLGLSVTEKAVQVSQVQKYDGAFICNAVTGISPLFSIDTHAFSWPSKTQSTFKKLAELLNQNYLSQ